MKVILHLDINAFFVSCHQKINPSLKGKPVVAVRNSLKGMVLAASYEAKKYGISITMPIGQALQQCRNLKLCFLNPKLYNYT